MEFSTTNKVAHCKTKESETIELYTLPPHTDEKTCPALPIQRAVNDELEMPASPLDLHLLFDLDDSVLLKNLEAECHKLTDNLQQRNQN